MRNTNDRDYERLRDTEDHEKIMIMRDTDDHEMIMILIDIDNHNDERH